MSWNKLDSGFLKVELIPIHLNVCILEHLSWDHTLGHTQWNHTVKPAQAKVTSDTIGSPISKQNTHLVLLPACQHLSGSLCYKCREMSLGDGCTYPGRESCSEWAKRFKDSWHISWLSIHIAWSAPSECGLPRVSPRGHNCKEARMRLLSPGLLC